MRFWANHAWGRYWGWDTKEDVDLRDLGGVCGVSARRATAAGRPRSAWLSIIGYACIIFNFTVVNIFFLRVCIHIRGCNLGRETEGNSCIWGIFADYDAAKSTLVRDYHLRDVN